MEPTLGARLRQQREARQVTLTTISTQTKIKIPLLEALESDDISPWPKGIYGRAYLRDYASAIGLEPESVVAEFLSLHPEYVHVAPDVEEAEAAARAEAGRTSAAQRFRRFVSSAFSARPRTAAESLAQRDDLAAADDGEIVGTSMSHVLAEAHERPGSAFAELDALEFHDNGEAHEAAAIPPIVTTPKQIAAAPPAASSTVISVSAIAEVCTRLARALDWREVSTLLTDSARLLDAVGVIVWQWDAQATALRPSFACGYSDTVMARLPEVRGDDENAVATAYRSGEPCVVDGSRGTEAVVVPSLGVGGCVGVLAVELRPGTRDRESICAFTSILAAQLAMLLPNQEPVDA